MTKADEIMKYKILRCPKCKNQLYEKDMGKRCPFCGEWQYHHLAETLVEGKEL